MAKRNVERPLPENIRVVHHVASENSPWFLKLFRRTLGENNRPSSTYRLVESIVNPDGQMESEQRRLFKTALKTSKLRTKDEKSKRRTRPAVETTLIIYDPPGTPEDIYNAPRRIGSDGRIHEKPIELWDGKRIYRR